MQKVRSFWATDQPLSDMHALPMVTINENLPMREITTNLALGTPLPRTSS